MLCAAPFNTTVLLSAVNVPELVRLPPSVNVPLFPLKTALFVKSVPTVKVWVFPISSLPFVLIVMLCATAEEPMIGTLKLVVVESGITTSIAEVGTILLHQLLASDHCVLVAPIQVPNVQPLPPTIRRPGEVDPK